MEDVLKADLPLEVMFLFITHFMSKTIKDYAHINSEKIPCSFSCPPYFTEEQKKFMFELLKYTDLDCDEIIPSYYCPPLTYVYENRVNYEEGKNEKLFLIADIGYTCGSFTLVKYYNEENKCEILNNCYDKKISGKVVDNILMKYFIDEINNQYKSENGNVDLTITPKIYNKIAKEIISMKEKLSANGADEIAVGIEIGNCDYGTTFSKKRLEDFLKENNLDKIIIDLMDKCLGVLNKEEIEKEEIELLLVGGTSRIPYFKGIMREKLKVKNSYEPLNMDECIAYGINYYNLTKQNEWKYTLIDKTKKLEFNDIDSYKKQQISTLKTLVQLLQTFEMSDELYKYEYPFNNYSRIYDNIEDNSEITEQYNKLVTLCYQYQQIPSVPKFLEVLFSIYKRNAMKILNISKTYEIIARRRNEIEAGVYIYIIIIIL